MANITKQVGVNDPQFMLIFEHWALTIAEALERNTIIPTYTASLEFYAQCHSLDLDPKVEIIKDIRRGIKKCKYSHIRQYQLGYDTEFVNKNTLVAILYDYNNKRRNLEEYDIAVLDIHSYTAALCPELLNYSLPRLNIVSISYNGKIF